MSDVTENRATERDGRATHTAHGEAQRQALARAAYQIIAESGFEGLRTRDVAERVGVNIATLHYYFSTKEDLVRGVMQLLMRGVHRRSMRPTSRRWKRCRRVKPSAASWRKCAIRSGRGPTTYIVLFELYMRSLRDPQIRADAARDGRALARASGIIPRRGGALRRISRRSGHPHHQRRPHRLQQGIAMQLL